MTGVGIRGREVARVAALDPADCPYCQAGPKDVPCVVHQGPIDEDGDCCWIGDLCPIHNPVKS